MRTAAPDQGLKATQDRSVIQQNRWEEWDGHRTTIALAAALTLAAGMNAQAAELRILISGAFKSPMADIKPLFEQASGHKLIVDADTSGRIAKRIADGEQTDFIMRSRPPKR